MKNTASNGVFINGLSQGGNAKQLITLDGTNAGSSSDGLLLQGSNCIVSGLLLEHFNNGIEVAGSNNIIGGTATGAGNVISGNTADGVLVDSGASGVSVQGNYIGTDVTGTKAVDNGTYGIEIAGSNNIIGGSATGAGNVISGNTNDGVLIGSGVSGTAVQGNYIGTDKTGANPLGNSGNGINIAGSNNTVGANNIISANSKNGVQVSSGAGNIITQNSIFANGALGISLASGANNNITAPTISSVILTGYTLTVKGSFSAATANVPYVLEFFDNTSSDAEGKAYIGSETVTPTSTGTQNFTFNLTTTVPRFYPLITATVTDNSGDTSQFSNGVSSGTIYVVTSAADSGTGTLRDAITQANNTASRITVIDFAIGTTGSAQTISLASALPALTANNVFINGLNQGGLSNTTRLITLDGTKAGSSSDGLLLQGSSDLVSGLILEHFSKNGIEVAGASNTIGGTAIGQGDVISGNTMDGVLIDSAASGAQVEGNYIGLDVSGKTILANGRTGVEVVGTNNTIGGNGASNYYTRNFISGNAIDGVAFDGAATGNVVQGNFIGLDISGTKAAGNVLYGIQISGSSNTVGGTTVGLGNVISGNTHDGILLGSTASSNAIQGNDIGTDYTGKNAVANSAQGVEILGAGNTLGGAASGARNIISGNAEDGVLLDSSGSGTLIQGNYVGINVSSVALPNASNGIEIASIQNTVGGTSTAARNILSGNKADGLKLDGSASGNEVLGNFVGVNLFSNAAANNNGIEVAGTQNTIGGSASGAFNVLSGNKNDGVLLDSAASGNVVLGNNVGLNVYGNIAVGNSMGIEVAGTHNTVGASYALAPNVISGNSKDGVLIDSGASGNQVLGNYIGTNHAGTAALANQVGIEDAGSGNTLGGSVLGARNVLSGNSGDGVLLDSTASEETVQGNYIGLNYNGKTALANGKNGVEVQGSNNLIGGNSGSNYFTRNFISGNTGDGLLIANGATGNLVQGNFIGLDVSGTNGAGNSIGIEVAGNSNTLGGASFGLGNVLSGNSSDGLRLDSLANNNLVQRNDVGTNYNGTSAVSNGGNGIEIAGTGNIIGGTAAAARNIISGNTNDGVLIDDNANGNQVLGSYIGTNNSGTGAVANKVGVEDEGNGTVIGGSVLGARNVISGNSGDGILVDNGSSTDAVQGNIIGLDYSAKIALANGSNGIEVQGGGTFIGGNSVSDYYVRNYISGNTGDGVLIDNFGDGFVEGNFIGLDISGTKGVGNSIGIEVASAHSYLGDTATGAGNVISGNRSDGVRLDSSANNNEVLGNDVGTDYTGKNAVGNGGNGVTILGNDNDIGDGAAATGNTIAYNGGDGVSVSVGVGNAITCNSIFANRGGGITLSYGGNKNLIAPILLTDMVFGSTVFVTGYFTVPRANAGYALQFFANPSGDAEGRVYLGTQSVYATSAGPYSFSFSTTTTWTGTYPLITATLTDSGDGTPESSDTSAFSNGVMTT